MTSADGRRRDVPAWPVLRTYAGERLRRVTLPLGGIGTGTIGLSGRGALRSWEIMNEPAKGYAPDIGFFAIRVATPSGGVLTRAAEGQLDTTEYEGAFGAPVPVAGLPRFRDCRFEAAYPLGQVVLTDPELPVEVRIQAFNPLVPTDPDLSGIPVAVLRFVVANVGAEAATVTVCGSLDNATGAGGVTARNRRERPDLTSARADEFHEDGLCGVSMWSEGPVRHGRTDGSLALAVLDPEAPSLRTSWPDLPWGNSLLDFWEDLALDGRVEDSPHGDRIPVCTVAEQRVVGAGARTEITFLVGWHFPNRRAWVGKLAEGIDRGRLAEDVVGNHYATRYADAQDVVTRTAQCLPDLESRTVEFVDAVCGSGLPPAVLEAALFNLSTLRSETCFRTADGRFFGWEGIGEDAGSCFGSCTHVWNYEQATAYLFGSLARSMREVEFGHATDQQGLMSFRVGLPLDKRQRDWRLAAADGQLGALVKLYRDWRLSGDDELLWALWPAARRALEFCWLPGGWDADRDGVMEGVQHNTMDVEYYGPNPQMGAWYLAALRSVAEIARHMGEGQLAVECSRLAADGAAWMDAYLFNGSYYRHEIRPVPPGAVVHEGVRHPTMGAADPARPELQLGDGCLVDQLVGQVLAHSAGLGHLLDPDHVRTALGSVLRLNWVADFNRHFNPMRTFAAGSEAGLVMAAYPPGVERPAQPFPYFSEVMTGFEYTAAVGLAYEGCFDEAERVFGAVRARYDGEKRNPFDEAECGRHYARAMASWTGVLAWTGFDYDGRTGVLTMAAAPGTARFWSTGGAWGVLRQDAQEVEVEVREGRLFLARLELTGAGRLALDAPRTLSRGECVRWNSMLVEQEPAGRSGHR